MKYSKFEKQIARELQGAQEPVQMDSLLASLDLGKEPEKSGRWIMIAFAFAAALSILIGSVAYFYEGKRTFSSNDLSRDSQSTISKLDASATTSLSAKATSQSADSGEAVISELASSQTSQNTIQNTSSVRNNKVANSTSVAIVADEINDNSDQSITKFSQGPEVANSTQVDYQSSIHKSTNRTGQASRVKFPAEDVISYNSAAKNLKLTRSQISTSTESQYRIPSANKSTTAANRATSTESNDLRLTTSVTRLGVDRDQVMVASLSPQKELFTRMKINCPSFNKAEYHLALIPEVGIFRPFKTIKSKSTEAPVEFPKRIADEKTLEGTTVGLHTMLVRDRVPLYFKAGLSYTRISEQMNLSYQYTQLDTTIGIISSTVSGNGDTLTQVFGPIVNETTFTGKNRQHYYMHMIDLPLSVGYTTYVAGFDIGIEGGINVNLLTQGTGNLLTSERDYTNLSFNDLFKKRIGVSYFGGLMIGRNFGPFGDIYLAPRFHYYPADFSTSINPISQNYLSVGINAGVVYTIK